MTLPRVVHINDAVPGAIYVGRAVPRRGIKASKWGNRHRVDVHGRVQAILLYQDELLDSPDLLAALPELRNVPALACWCRHDGEERTPENECHADVLVWLLDIYTDDELRVMGDQQ